MELSCAGQPSSSARAFRIDSLHMRPGFLTEPNAGFSGDRCKLAGLIIDANREIVRSPYVLLHYMITLQTTLLISDSTSVAS